MDEYICDVQEHEHMTAEINDIREEIIRCRDCKHVRRLADGKVEWCAVNHDADGFCLNVIDDGFCAWAERASDD